MYMLVVGQRNEYVMAYYNDGYSLWDLPGL